LPTLEVGCSPLLHAAHTLEALRASHSTHLWAPKCCNPLLVPQSLLCTSKGVFTTKTGFCPLGHRPPWCGTHISKSTPKQVLNTWPCPLLNSSTGVKSCFLVGEGAQKLGGKPLLCRRVAWCVPSNIMSALRNKQ
jgi:hypothetical protein